VKIVIYCQHVLGIGHLLRTVEICRALASHEVILVSGGPALDGPVPKHVQQVKLPDLQMNREFKALFSSRGQTPLEKIKTERRRRLLALFERERPDLLLIELYPFGRKAFRFELDPLLDHIHRCPPPHCRIVCSVRDILVEKEDAARHEYRALETLNRRFDAVLVHADPGLVGLEETFGPFSEIAIPVIYTGYVAARVQQGCAERVRRRLQLAENEALIIASAGSGSVGARLLESAVRAFERLQARNRCRLVVFSGPFITAREFEKLNQMAGRGVIVEKFAPDFLCHLAAADLSLSMGGYNTTMNILVTGVRALVWPFAQNREQRLRAERLEKLDALTLLADEDLHPSRLAARMDAKLAAPAPPPVGLNLDGAANTARWIEQAF